MWPTRQRWKTKTNTECKRWLIREIKRWPSHWISYARAISLPDQFRTFSNGIDRKEIINKKKTLMSAPAHVCSGWANTSDESHVEISSWCYHSKSKENFPYGLFHYGKIYKGGGKKKSGSLSDRLTYTEGMKNNWSKYHDQSGVKLQSGPWQEGRKFLPEMVHQRESTARKSTCDFSERNEDVNFSSNVSRYQ